MKSFFFPFIFALKSIFSVSQYPPRTLVSNLRIHIKTYHKSPKYKTFQRNVPNHQTKRILQIVFRIYWSIPGTQCSLSTAGSNTKYCQGIAQRERKECLS